MNLEEQRKIQSIIDTLKQKVTGIVFFNEVYNIIDFNKRYQVTIINKNPRFEWNMTIKKELDDIDIQEILDEYNEAIHKHFFF